MSNVITVAIRTSKKTVTRSIYQYDHGMILKVVGIESEYEIHFCNVNDSSTTVVLGDADGVLIPDELIQTGKNINAYIYTHTGEDDGYTVHEIQIPVKPRPSIGEEPTPVPSDPNSPVVS